MKVKGEAEAYAIEAKAKAEAEQMQKKADAWKDYQDAAMIDMVLETLPKVGILRRVSCRPTGAVRILISSILPC